MVTGSINRLLTLVREEWWLARANSLGIPLADESICPFFIVSAGRSGTTLLRKKLLNSDHIYIPPESEDFIPYNAIRFVRHNNTGWEHIVRETLSNFEQQPFRRFWSTDITGLGAAMANMPPEKRSYGSLINELYMHVARSEKPKLQVWGDKTPYLMYRLKWLRKVFPPARYIHLVRDGRAVVSSMVKTQNYTLRQAVLRWKDSLELFARHRRYVRPESVLEIRYEEFVSDPAATLSEVCKFLGVPFEEEMLRDRSIKMGDDILPHHRNLHNAISTSSIDQWRYQLSGAEISFLNDRLRNELERLRYEI